MVTIPNEIKEFIEKQGIFAVGTIGAITYQMYHLEFSLGLMKMQYIG